MRVFGLRAELVAKSCEREEISRRDPHPARLLRRLATLSRPLPDPPPLAGEGRVGAGAGEG